MFIYSDQISWGQGRGREVNLYISLTGKEECVKNTFSWLGGSSFMIALIDMIAWIKTTDSPSEDSISLFKDSAMVWFTLKDLRWKKEDLFINKFFFKWKFFCRSYRFYTIKQLWLTRSSQSQ